MAEPFIGEIRMFGGNYAPEKWAFCNGQIVAITSFQALYSLIGTTYGGDGRTTFGLPDLRGRAPIHYGQGPGLTNYPLGARTGQDRTVLTEANMPAHRHQILADDTGSSPSGPVYAFCGPTSLVDADFDIYSDDTSDVAQLSPSTLSTAGQAIPVENKAPYQVINFIIALEGAYPPRS